MIKKWWMESVGYQIYPKSFYDSNHDGIGDLKGIIEKLPYLSKLGIDLIWIGPVYDSPMDDNGYDVRDFYQIDKMFGNLNDMKTLIDKAHALNIKIILDYVLNHTSDEHPWFLESRSSKNNPYRDFYIWQEGKLIKDKIVEPTNWGSFFGGSCWQFDEISHSYYMKIFSNKMPDLNWKNPEVRKSMIDVGKWWLNLGIDGFRIDAVSHLERAPFEDVKNSDEKYPLDWHKFSNLPKVHDYVKELNQKVFAPNDCLAIGEVGGEPTIESALSYAGFDANELSMVFFFDHNWCNNIFEVEDPNDLKINVIKLKEVFLKWQLGFNHKGWLPLNWLNHDQPRLMSHYGKLKYFKASGKMLATLMYLMKGTPFVYQGEEIGMTNYPFTRVEEFNDISSINYYNYLINEKSEDQAKAMIKTAMKSRDNARTPMQWSNQEYAGFSTVKPWLKANPNYKQINVASQMDDADSIWTYYQKLFKLRKESKYRETIIYGQWKLLDIDHDKIITYVRSDQKYTLLIINNLTEELLHYSLNQYVIKTMVLSNNQVQIINENELSLKPYGSIVLEVEEKS
jgi:glycosidase